MTAPAAAEAAAPRPSAPRSAVRGDADSARALVVQAPAALTGSLVGVLLLAAIFWPLAPAPVLLGWLACAALLWGLRLAHHLRRGPDADALRHWHRAWTALVLAQGALWGAAAWLFWGLGTPYQMLALVLIVFTSCVSAVQLLALQPVVFMAYLALALMPAIARVASDGNQPWHLQLAVILLLLLGVIALAGRSHGQAMAQAQRLKARTDELAERLRAEAALAEQARREAEAATLAKTQFFAAASHDLRQPLHAMGLFAETLRQRTHDPEVAALVNSINESVDALEGLFAELLDITRLDAGAVEVRPAPVRLQEIFARLRLHFEPVAFEKGLQLSLRGGRHVAHADPLLLERVLRNLVSNALRYTEDGGVLVGCRRRGEQLLLQVWDSGIGIDESSLPRIWDEFYQVQRHRAPSGEQRKGLGLGLSIVRRLTRLMDTPVEVRSRVGHGTVFSLSVPRAPVPPLDATAAPAPRTSVALRLDGRRLLVVEDEPAVREGLVVLLRSWGATVCAFDSVEALQAGLDAGGLPAPDLLLVDHRLPGGHTGPDALRLARLHWSGRPLPAVVITGSSLGGHEAEAVRHDYHVLLKPVLPARLRAMIAFKLGAAASR